MIDALYTEVDDFNKKFYPEWEKSQIESEQKKRRKKGMMTPSEVMTIIIHFHQSNHKDFKNYYLGYVHQRLCKEFPQLLSYTRFLAVMPTVLVPLCALFGYLKGKPTGIAFINSTSMKVCHTRGHRGNIRIPRHKVFKGIAQRGKTSMGWFYGFKLHIIINHKGEILATKLTVGNIDDRKPVPDLIDGIMGKLYGDKGYLSKALGEECFDKGIELITNVRSNMKPVAIKLWDKIMLKKRYIIETINDHTSQLPRLSIKYAWFNAQFNGFIDCVLSEREQTSH